MKRLLITLSVFCFLLADNPVGNWKLSGLKVDYINITRLARTVALQDAYNVGVSVPVSEIPSGAVFYRLTNGPFTQSQIDNYPLNLNVNLYNDGTGAVAQGSFYPDIELIPGTCITSPQIFPVTDNFVFTVGGETTFPALNVIGVPGINDYAGSTAFGFGVQGSGTFEDFPSSPSPAQIPPGLDYLVAGSADPNFASDHLLGATCETAVIGQACAAAGFDAATQLTECLTALAYAGQYVGDGSGAVEQQVVGCLMDTNPAYGGSYAGSANWGGAGWLHGSGTSGFFATDNLGNSQVPGQENMGIDFLLEWNGIDGGTEETLGIGDDEDDVFEDEYICQDADGNAIEGCNLNTDAAGNLLPGAAFDRIFGLPYIPATYITADCPLAAAYPGFAGLDKPIAGDLTGLAAQLVAGECYAETLAGVEGGCYGSVLAGVEQGCYDQVQAGVEAQCDAAGDPVTAVTGVCFDASQTSEFAGACAYYGAAGALVATCLQLGFDEETCNAAATQAAPAVDAYCVYATGYDCATAGIDECSVLTDPTFAAGLCGTLAGALTTSETCSEWADSFSDEWLNDQAAQNEATGFTSCTDLAANLALGYQYGDLTAIATLDAMAAGNAATGFMSCPDLAATLAAGYAAGDAGALAQLDDLAATVVGMGCGDYGAVVEGLCISSVVNANDMFILDPSLSAWGMFLTYNAASYQQVLGGCVAAGLDADTCAGYIAGNVDFDGQGGYGWTLVDDSAGEFDPSCYYTGETCGGKLHMVFDPLCVPVIEGRQIVAEFIDLNDVCDADGDVNYTCQDSYGLCTAVLAAQGLCPAEDVNAAPILCSEQVYGAWMYYEAQLSAVGVDLSGCTPDLFGQPFPDGDILEPGECFVGDGITNVIDVVNIIGHILGTLVYTEDQCLANGFDPADCAAGPVGYELGGTAGCAADINGDNAINVVDVVVIVGNILGGRIDQADATHANVSLIDNNISIEADGYIGGIDMVVEYEGNLNIVFADNFAAQYVLNDDNTARIIMVNDASIEDVLTATSGKITAIRDITIATSDTELNNVGIDEGVMPAEFNVSSAYPNPFNPTTKFSLELNTTSDISVKVYNILGQLVDVVAQGTYSPSSYSWTWNAENLASGVYLVKTTVGNSVHKQKIMLLK